MLAIELGGRAAALDDGGELARRRKRSFAVLGTGRRAAAEGPYAAGRYRLSADLLDGAERDPPARLAVSAAVDL